MTTGKAAGLPDLTGGGKTGSGNILDRVKRRHSTERIRSGISSEVREIIQPRRSSASLQDIYFPFSARRRKHLDKSLVAKV
jgi:hypothetical protein